MKKTPERIEQLAAAYVLGTLQGPARRRFERWMMESWRVRQEVWAWEARLGELAARVPAETPPPRLWQAIERRLWPSAERPDRPRWFGWWVPGWSLALVAVFALVTLMVRQPAVELPEPLLAGAVVQQGVDEPLWLISQTATGTALQLRPVAAALPEAGRDYELWALPVEGNPVSLGLLAADQPLVTLPLSQHQRQVLADNRTLAISLEPTGGSPTGVPTGPVLHLVRLHSS
ncbi:MAG: anti-sigma factor [Marinobacter sp.]|nr:anti-sigma factor [Marinobacter sp.]